MEIPVTKTVAIGGFDCKIGFTILTLETDLLLVAHNLR